MIVDNLFNDILQGKHGKNKGIGTGMPKLDSITYGVQRRWFTVIGGDSGSGKSYYTLYTAVYKPYCHYLQCKRTNAPIPNINFLLFSFEMSAEVLLARLLSMHIYDTYGRVISYSDILSFLTPISENDYNLIVSSREWLDELETLCTIIDKPVSANGLYGICKDWSRKFGEYRDINEHREDYMPKDSQQYLIVVVDHIKLLSVDGNSTSKQEIDKASNYLIYFRNKCNFTVYVVQQLNRNFKSMARRTEASGVYAGIQLDDFSDSSGTIQSAEVVLAIFYPAREKMSKCCGYKICNGLGEKGRIISVLKNRCGVADKNVGTVFHGEIGMWKELPKPEDIDNYEDLISLTQHTKN